VLAKVEADENMKLAGATNCAVSRLRSCCEWRTGRSVQRRRSPDFVREFLDRHLDNQPFSRPA